MTMAATYHTDLCYRVRCRILSHLTILIRQKKTVRVNDDLSTIEVIIMKYPNSLNGMDPFHSWLSGLLRHKHYWDNL